MSSRNGGYRGGKDICRQFQKSGTCRFGSRCKFSHDTTGTSKTRASRGPRPAQVFVTRAVVPIDECDTDLSQELSNHLKSALTDPTRFDQVWTTALRLLNRRDDEINHRTVYTLVTEDSGGLKVVEATSRISHRGAKDHIMMVERFLRSLGHIELVNSLSLASQVDKIYTAFAGQTGEEGLAFLQGYCELLSGDHSLTEMLQSSVLAIMTTTLLIMSQLFARVPRARQDGRGKGLFTALENFASVSFEHEHISKVDYNLFMDKISTMKNACIKSKPGSCTAIESPGGRHDNDFESITDIEIFPTHDEIMSDKPEYLPITVLTNPSILEDPLQRHLDTTFRLMRHDIFGSMKAVLKSLLAQTSGSRTPTLPDNDAGANLYPKANIRSIFVNERNDLEAVVSFQGLPHVVAKSFADQSEWWKGTPRLEEGSLISFLSRRDGKSRLLFLQVALKNPSNVDHNVQKSCYPSTLVSKNKLSSITVKLVNSSTKDLDLLCDLYRNGTEGLLVSFHGLIPATFYPVLTNLQRVQREGELALRQWILPSPHSDSKNIPPPAYSRHPEFVFDLGSVAKCDMILDAKKPIESFSLSDLEEKSGLDHGQCRGLVDALTREYSLIQGPPGTGKSFLGQKIVKVLTSPQSAVKMGPILIVCYTNHALDQFLKHLMDGGTDDIVRIGSRSEAPELEDKNILVVSRTTKKTNSETNSLFHSGKGLDEAMEKVSSALSTLNDRNKQPTWAALEGFLLTNHPLIHSQLKPTSPPRYQNATNKDPLLNWLGKRALTPTNSNNNIGKLTHKAEWDIRALSNKERWALVEGWIGGASHSDNSTLHDALQEAEGQRATMNNIREEVRRRTLMNVRVIGMTTTALAKNIDTLRKVGIKVVICEEAAEVTEAHMLSALMPSVEHFIQIGDHRQLRPQINDFRLSLESSSGEKWQLDRSQFERRAIGEPGLEAVPVAQLSVQRRMKPEISKLIRRVYPLLEDHDSTKTFPKVVGMRENLFWLDHRHFEDGQYTAGPVRSHSNTWEVSMATALVRHLVRQGAYDSSDIALLTPYTGQLQQLKTALGKEFEIRLNEKDQKKLEDEDAWVYAREEPEPAPEKYVKKPLLQTLRVATIDNFQGEEAKVIIVSLVRSNPARQVGFLATENRINVLLSRAQHGMYLIGNANTYMNVPMWAEVHQQFLDAGNVGTQLEICCPRHPETAIVCSEPRDFKNKSPDGGCTAACGKALECGHKCTSKCHSDMMHQATPCHEPCNRRRDDCDHPCPKLCKDDCGPCTAILDGLELYCGHIKKNAMCKERLSKIDIICNTKVEKLIPFCKHSALTECLGRPEEIEIFDKVKCISICGKKLGCGHVCGAMCTDCVHHDGWCDVYQHQPCKVCG